MNYTSYVTQDKDRWDSIANKMYGDSTLAPLILAVNGDVSILAELPGGITLKIPIRTDPLTGNDLPPWATDEDNTVENPDDTDTSIPVNPAPIVELAFAPGYPVVEGNKIKFAINKSGTYPYAVKTLDGVIVSSSPAYLFTAGFPVLSPDITQAGIYVVEVGSIVSDQITMPGTTALVFTTAPFFYRTTTDVNTIRYAINKTGSYQVKVIRLSDNVEVYAASDSHTDSVIRSIPVETPNVKYRLEVSTLQAVVSVYEACGRGPSIYGDVLNATENQLTFQFDGDGVERMRVWIERQGSKLRQAELVYLPKATPQDTAAAALPDKPVQFFTGNIITFEYPTLEPQPFLQLKLAGLSCKEEVITYRDITLNSSVLAFTVGYPRVNNGVLEIRINRPQPYRTIVRNETTSEVIVDTTNDYGASPMFTVADLPDGYYLIVVGTIAANILIDSGEGEIPDPEGAEPIGAYMDTVDGRVFSQIKNDKFVLDINSDGSLSDVTPGTDHSGAYATQDGKRCFYMIGYSIFGSTALNGVKSYKKFLNIWLPSQEPGRVYTIKRFVESVAGSMDFNYFVTNLNNGVNMNTAQMSEIPMSITDVGASLNKTNWLRASRHLRLKYFGTPIPANGKFGAFTINKGDTPESLQALGVNTKTDIGTWQPQSKTFYVHKWYPDGDQPTREQLYSWGRMNSSNFKMDENYSYWDEVVENTQGNDPEIDDKLPELYRGVLDDMRTRNPAITVLNSGMKGPYGLENYNNFFSRFQLDKTYAQYVDFMTTHLHWVADPATGNYNFVSSFFTKGHIDYRNFNFNLYIYNEVFHLPLLVISAHEKAKRSSMTYDGQNRERKVGFITATGVQSLVGGANGIGIEYNTTKELIPFPNGTIAVKNLSPASLWDEMFIASFYIALTKNDFDIWGGWEVGLDKTRLNKATWYEQQVDWIPNVGSRQTYVPGQNGAPLMSEPGNEGLETSSQSNPTDAAYAARDWVRSFMTSSSVVYWGSFVSDKYSFTPTTGTTGLHLNGFGALNEGGYNEWRVSDSKTGLPLVCDNGSEKWAIYTNSFLSQDEYEDDVIVSHDGDSVNMGRCYGRGIYVKQF